MKRMIALLLSFAICILLCSCAPLSKLNTISYNDDASEMYYNGNTYINYNNYNGKYRVDLERDDDSDNWVKIATMPYSFFTYTFLGAVTEYYGNNAENPELITNTRSFDFYVRKDITIDHSLTLSVRDTDTPFRFNIADATTGNVITYDLDKRYDFKEVCNFFATFEDYPGVQLWITIRKYNGKLYLQDVEDSDYYEITEAFKEDLYRFGINTFDYH